MRISQLSSYVVKCYESERARSRSFLFLGPPRIGKSTAIYEAAEILARKLHKKFVPFRLYWRHGRFVLSEDGYKDIFEVLENPEEYFILIDLRLSTIASEDLIGIPRSHNLMSFYEPLAWAVLAS